MTTGPVFKLLTEGDWALAEASGATDTALDRADGYVHLSTNAQVRETARRYYSGQARVRLLRFDLATLGDIRWEESRGGDLFPHLYGALEIARATGSWWLAPGPDGAPVIPEDV
ncbi:DUF952 domain-containing protein [Hyphomonas sp.]|uniref:DUF952 domain-containing protein n=1 Tax=Hyphomonas sp. TaxID=87 RepID=UPI000AF9937B|nr:DUF952 domain-containing protein [Hyphomonas sp.]